MKKFLVLLGCLAIQLVALDINESVELVLQKSHKVKEQQMILKRLQSELGIYQGAYYPKVDLSYRGSYEAISNRFGNTANLGVDLNLFNGLKDQSMIASQQKSIQAQEEEVKRIQEEIKYMTKKLYTQILLTKGGLEILKESAKLLEIQLSQAQQFYKQGIWAKNNVLSVEVSLASANLEINSASTKLNYLVSALQEMTESQINVNALQDLPLSEEDVDYDRLSLIIFEYKPEYKAMRHKVEVLQNELLALKGNYYPKVDFGVSGDFGGNKFGDSQVFVGFNVRLNLFNGLKDFNRVEAKQYEILALESKISAYKKEVLTELKRAVGDFNLAKDQYVLSQKAIENAQENYRIVSNRYKQKLETSNTLLDAELMLKNARANLLKSKYAIWENLFYVEFLIGGKQSLFF